MPKMSGKRMKRGKNSVLLKTLVLTRTPRPIWKMSMAKMIVRSATFEPKSVPSPNSGIPARAEFTAIMVSGSIEMSATTMKPIT